MKKAILLALIIFFSLIFSVESSYYNVACAENDSDTTSEIERELEDEIDKSLDEIKLSEFESFVASLESEITQFYGSSVKDYIKKVTNGEVEFNLVELFNIILNAIGKEILSLMPLFITVIIIAILSGIVSNLSSGFLQASTSKTIEMVCTCAIVIAVVTVLGTFVTMTTDIIANINKLVIILFPIILTLLTATGSVSSYAVFKPLINIFASGIIGIITYVIIPLFITTIVFSIIGSLSNSIKLDKLTKFFKTLGEWILGGVFGIFMTVTATQGITGMTLDSISIKATKFAISSYVPILGGYLSDGFDLVTASCLLIKNAVGVSGLIALLAILLVPIIKLVVFALGIKLTAALIEPVSDKKISDMLSHVSDGTTMLITSLLGVGFMLFVIIMMLIYSFNAM